MDPLSLITGFANMLLGPISQSQSNRENERLVDKRNRLAIEQWRRETTYNNPVNQMMRLKAAGLNPNLMYGHLSGQLGAAGSPDMATAQVSSTGYRIDPLTVAQIENINADTEEKRANATSIKETLPLNLEKLSAETDEISANISVLQSQKSKNEAETYLSKILSGKAYADALSSFEDFRYKQSALVHRLKYIEKLANKTGSESDKLEEELEIYGDMLKQQFKNLQATEGQIKAEASHKRAEAALQEKSKEFIYRRAKAETDNAEANLIRAQTERDIGTGNLEIRSKQIEGQLQRWEDQTTNERLKLSGGLLGDLLGYGTELYQGRQVEETWHIDSEGRKSKTYKRHSSPNVMKSTRYLKYLRM